MDKIFVMIYPIAIRIPVAITDRSQRKKNPIALEWDAAFKNLNDPSGRAVAGVHIQAY